MTEFAGWNSGGYGNLVVIRHRLGYTTWYAHLSSITTWVGEEVTGGTRIGYVGSTGHSTGPHLHFELRKNAVPIDPMPYLLQAVATRASAARASSTGGGGAFNGSTEGDAGGSSGSGGGVAARACPIRAPLVKYRRAPLDACRTKNLTRAALARRAGAHPPAARHRLLRSCTCMSCKSEQEWDWGPAPGLGGATPRASCRGPSLGGRAPCRESLRPRPSRARPRGSSGRSAPPPARSRCRGRSR